MKLILAEVVTIGDEILYGQITDTNTVWMSTELDKIGIKTVRKSSVGDQEDKILQILEEAGNRADIVLLTGGLGPTKDDITKKTLCRYFNDELIMNEDALAFVTEFFNKRGRPLTEINRQQALIPSLCTYLPNKTGTAPGMWFEKKEGNERGTIYVSMPGVPSEMKYLMANEVIPRLKKYFETPVIYHKMIRTIGIGESLLAEKIEKWEDSLPPHIKLAYLPSFGQVRLRLTGVGENEEILKQEVQEEVDKVLPLIQSFVFGFDDEDIEAAIGKLLKSKDKTVSAAESCTGGFVSHMFTKVPGSSAYFMGSVVSYDNSVKMNVLGVKPETLQAHGAVSEETVTQMAEGVRALMKTDYAIATTGVAGPDGGTPEKPVGTLWIACAMEGKTVARKVQMSNQRDTNINYGSVVALNLLRKMLIGDYES